MKFWASSETYQPADAAVERARRIIEPLLQNLLSDLRPDKENLLLRYVPIVMPTDMLDRYPERFRAYLKQAAIDCGPQLDYKTFVEGSFADQVEVYLNGIGTASRQLPKFGFSPADIRDFQALLAKAGHIAVTGRSEL